MSNQNAIALINGGEGQDREHRRLAALLNDDLGALSGVVASLLTQRRELKGKIEALGNDINDLMQPPLHIHTVLHEFPDLQAVLVQHGSGLRLASSVITESTPPGTSVLVNGAGVAVDLYRGPTLPAIATLEDVTEDGIAVVKGQDGKLTTSFIHHSRGSAKRLLGKQVFSRGGLVVNDYAPNKATSEHELEHPPKQGFEAIGGLRPIISQIKQDLDLHLVHQKELTPFKLRPMSGITLTGPPGCGKTMMARAMAHHLAASGRETRFLNVKPGSLRNLYYGETESNIRKLFEAARTAPDLCIIFFDELDTFGTRSKSAGSNIESRVLPALLSEIDGLEHEGRIICIGATNRLDLCDQALIREGRFGDRIFEVPRPDRGATESILRRYLATDLPYMEKRNDVLVGSLRYLFEEVNVWAKVTMGSGEEWGIQTTELASGALYAAAIEKAKHSAAARYIQDPKTMGLTTKDVVDALESSIQQEVQKIMNVEVARTTLSIENAASITKVEPYTPTKE